ncbi:MAG: hypothetical protein CMN60_15025 [Sphingobium sp.]|nr:hypothetical protein [Sphingobium sp.]
MLDQENHLPSDGVGMDDATPIAVDGWRPLDRVAVTGFETALPPLDVRAVPGGAEMRVQPHTGCANVMGSLHGGFLSAIAEQSLFLPLYLHGRCSRGDIVVIDFTLSFLASGDIATPIVARLELLRETGRMAFVRGTLWQGDVAITAYSGTVRKLDKR